MSAEECRSRAAECLRLANEANSARAKARLTDMAGAWLRLSDQADKNSKADLSYQTPKKTPEA